MRDNSLPLEFSGPPESHAAARGIPRHEIAGVDEAGRGPWAGPVVAAAVILPSPARRDRSARAGGWWRFGVRVDDSKRLTPRQRACAYHAILQHAVVGVGIMPATEIDAGHIGLATLAAMAQAVNGLERVPALVLVDGLQAPPVAPPCWTIVRGDQRSPAIACASIVAKVLRDSLMQFYHRLFPAYGFQRHVGYGTEGHLQALRAHGPSALHRLSFAPVAQWPREG